MVSRIRFVELALLLVLLNVMDMFTTIVGVQFFNLYEVNLLIANRLIDKPLLLLAIKIFVPLIVSLYLYHRVGLKTHRISIWDFTLKINSLHILRLANIYYLIIVSNNIFWIVREILKL